MNTSPQLLKLSLYKCLDSLCTLKMDVGLFVRKWEKKITLDIKLIIWGPHKIIRGPHLGSRPHIWEPLFYSPSWFSLQVLLVMRSHHHSGTHRVPGVHFDNHCYIYRWTAATWEDVSFILSSFNSLKPVLLNQWSRTRGPRWSPAKWWRVSGNQMDPLIKIFNSWQFKNKPKWICSCSTYICITSFSRGAICNLHLNVDRTYILFWPFYFCLVISYFTKINSYSMQLWTKSYIQG